MKETLTTLTKEQEARLRIEQEEYNTIAFQQVFGDEDDLGAYIKFKSDALKNVTVDSNLAAPCRADFCCDIDNVISRLVPEKDFDDFVNHYVLGFDVLLKKKQKELEQKIGQELRNLGLVLVSYYFKTIRKKREN